MGAATVDAYIAGQPAPVRRALARMRAVLRKALPAAEEAISYGMPAYKLDGRVVVYFAGWKQHTALYPGGGATIDAFKDELAAYELSRGTIRFSLDRPVPARLIARIAKHRARAVAERQKAKAAPKNKKR